MLIQLLLNFDELGQACPDSTIRKIIFFCTCILFVIIFPNSRYAYPAKEKIRNLIGRSSRDSPLIYRSAGENDRLSYHHFFEFIEKKAGKLASSWNSPRTIEELAGN